MVELIGDPCAPSDFNLPLKTTTQANAMSGAGVIISGTMIYNVTLGKAEVYSGTQWETITSVAR